jgi:flavin reductase (DIM6/NTAB) family NADH-FMN oxidoreductase RutF
MNNSSDNFELQGEAALKAVFRIHASGIAILTANAKNGEPIGFTASSVTSLGSTPPLLSVNISQSASSYEHLQIGSKVAIHTLDSETLDLARRLAGPREQRFTGNEEKGPNGIPILVECPSILIGEVVQRFEIESNAVLVVSVTQAHINRIPESPLVYFQRAWYTIGQKLSDNS